MKKYITYTITALFATIAVSSASPDTETIISNEKAAWQTFKEKKADDFKKLLHSNFMAVYKDGIYTLQKEMDLMPKMDAKSFTLTDFNVVFPDENTATITCKVVVDAAVEGKDISGNYNSGSIWKKQSGKWVAIFHTDMKEEPASK